jgi:hypothetical protein
MRSDGRTFSTNQYVSATALEGIKLTDEESAAAGACAGKFEFPICI